MDSPQFDQTTWDAPALPQRWQLPPVLQRMFNDINIRITLIEAAALLPATPAPPATLGGLAAGPPPKDPQ